MNELASVFDGAAADRLRGAAAIEIDLVEGLLRLRSSWTAEGLQTGADRLLAGQPAMANLRSLSRRIDSTDLERLETRLTERLAVLRKLGERLTEAAWPWIEERRRVLTLSRSSSVSSVMTGAWNRGWRGETIVFDGSSAGRGREQAAALAETLDRVRSQPDAAMSGWLETTGCLVLLGADAVSPLRLVNACGTAALLELASGRSVPVAIVADSGKDVPDGEIDEILAAGRIVDDGDPGRRWPIFESAPVGLATTRIHE